MKKSDDAPLRPGFVYALFDPRTNEPRYVGCCFDTASRFAAHMRGARNVVKRGVTKDTLPKDVWLAELLRLGLAPELRLLEKVSAHGYLPTEAEAGWILRLRKEGFSLTNTGRRKGVGRNYWTVTALRVWVSCDGTVHSSPRAA